MPLHGHGHHSRSQSHSGNTPDIPQQSLSSLVQPSQSLSGVANPAAAGATSASTASSTTTTTTTTTTTATTTTAATGYPQQKQRLDNHSHSIPNLRVQTSTSDFVAGTSSNNNSGITPIHSGASSVIISSATSAVDPSKKSISFHLPSPNATSPGGRHQQNQQKSEPFQSPQDRHPSSALQSHPPHHLPQRPTDPTQTQQLSSPSNSQSGYYPSSATGSRSHLPSTVTASAAVPQASQPRPPMHPTNTGGNPGYSPNLSLNTGVGDGNSGSRKYTHPGALTPTYPTSSQHNTSHSHSGAAHLGIGLSGLSGNSNSMRDREEVVPSTGAVGPGRWMSPYGLYAIDWCKWNPSSGGSGPNGYGRIAVGSYAEDSHNYIQVLDTRPGPADPQQPGAPTLEFTKLAEATHTYPITRVLWEPPSSEPLTDHLATSGDHLRLWSLPSPSISASPSNSITSRNYQTPTQKLIPLALLSNSKSTDFTAPLTSLDWNQVSPSLIITSSIDTTCTIWDIPTLTAKTQLIAHDKEVFDVRFMSNSVDVFASCGADGSVRMFDLRSLEHSTIIYEPGGNKSSSSSSTGPNDRESGGSPVNSGAPPALLRLAASPHDQHLISTFCTDSSVVRILDVRQPGQALVELKGHNANVNCCEWNPGRRGVLAAGGDDCEVLVWDIFGASGSSTTGSSGGIKSEKGVEQERNPIAWWSCEVEVNNLSWSPSVGKTGSDWIGIVGGRGVWGLGV